MTLDELAELAKQKRCVWEPRLKRHQPASVVLNYPGSILRHILDDLKPYVTKAEQREESK